jgi:hypothetical protein
MMARHVQPSMEKRQIDPEPRVVDSQAALPADEKRIRRRARAGNRQVLDQRLPKI